METKDINIAAGKTMPLQAHGSGFRFESGTSTTTDKYIKVTPERGPVVLIKPGQQFQIDHAVGNWTLAANDAAAVLTGRVVIFNKGENFADSNVNNTFTLDATLANNVTVMNDATKRIPVSLGTSPVETRVAPMSYTNSFQSIAGTAANVAQVVLAAGANVNGVTVSRSLIERQATNGRVFIAKAGAAPVTITDGDVLAYSASNATQGTDEELREISVAAGKGLYFIENGASSGFRSLLYTVL